MNETALKANKLFVSPYMFLKIWLKQLNKPI